MSDFQVPSLTMVRHLSIDHASMTPQVRLDADFYAALWIGALMLDAGEAIEVCPAELDDLAVHFFARCRPVAKA